MNQPYQDFLERMLKEGYEGNVFPSAAAAIGVHGQVLAEAFTGEWPVPGGAPVDEHTRYDMASLSKILGPTMLSLKGLAAGDISLTDTVGKFFPDCPEDKKDITIFMLMTHTGGFYPEFRLDRLLTDPADTLKCILEHELKGKPGEHPMYSCMGYILLGKILERVYGEPLKDLARKRVFEPLGMTETGYCPAPGTPCAATEVDPVTGKPWTGIVHDENARFQLGNSGNAGVFMSLRDGITFASMLSDMGGDFLPREIMEQAVTNYTPGEDEYRGLGFQMAGSELNFMSTRVPLTAFGHTGFTGTSMMVEPESGFWVILLTNRVYPTRNTTLLFPFRRKLHGEAWDLFQSEGGEKDA